MKELQVCSLEWTGSEWQVCLRFAEHCSFVVVVVVAAAADFVGADSIAGLDQERGSVAAGCYL